MKRQAILLLASIWTFYLAGAAAAKVVPLGGGEAEAPPRYDVKADATAESVLADARAYFEERSYAWALAAADALSARWPDSAARAEGDYLRLRCLMQLERFADADRAFEDYFKRHGDGLWAAEAVDFLLDVYSDCEYVDEDYRHRVIAKGWDAYLENTYGYSFRSGSPGADAIEKKRYEILALGDRVYGALMAAAPDRDARRRYADRRVFNYVKMSTFLDWYKYQEDERRYYDERKRFNDRVAAYEMSGDMRSMVAFMAGLLDLYALPAPSGGPDKDRVPWRQYGAWRDGRRLAAARASWEKVAAEYGAAPGALMARAALAHYQFVFDNEPEKAAAAFAEIATLSADAEVAASIAGIVRGLAAPALAVTGVTTSPSGEPEVAVALACRGLPEVEASVYEVDPAQYPAFYDAFVDGGTPAPALPGVKGEAATTVIITGCQPGGYRLATPTATFDDLAAGFYLFEARAGDELSRAVFSLTGAAVIGADDGHDLYLEAVDAVTGEPVPIEKTDAWLVSYGDRGFQEIEDIRPITLATRPEGAGMKADLRLWPQDSSVYLVLATPRGPVIYAAATAYKEYDGESSTLKGKVVTDRPLYRPGDTVRYKVIWREVDYAAKTMRAAAGRDVDVGLYSDYWHGEPLLSATATTDEFGACAGEFVIPETARLGGLTIVAKVKEGDRDRKAEGDVNLAEPAKPEYELRLEPSAEFCVAGEAVSVTVAGKYYSGEPMAGAPLAYGVDYDAHKPGGGERGALIKDTRARLDENGRYVISFRTPGAKEFDSSVYVRVKLGDETAHILAASEQIEARKTDRYAVIEPDKLEYQTGEVARFTVRAFDLGGTPVAGRVVVEVYAALTAGRPEYQRGELLAAGTVNVPATGEARYTLSLTDPPPYVLIVARTTGTNGVADETEDRISFYGEEEDALENRRLGDVRLRPREAEAAVGDAVAMTVTSRVAASSCLVLIYADEGKLEARRVPLAASDEGYVGSFTVPITDRYFPRVQIYSFLVSGGESYADSWTTATIAVKNPSPGIKVVAAPATDKYRPSDEAALRVECRGADGGPLPADVSVAVVDEALLALAPDRTADVPAFFADALSRHAECEITDSLRSRGEIAKVVYRFPYYARPYGAFGTDFLPVGVEKWGPAARLIERVSLKDVYDPALEEYFDLSMQKELAGGADYLYGANDMTEKRLEQGRFISPFARPGRRRGGVADLGGVPSPKIGSGAGGGGSAGGSVYRVREDFADAAFWAPSLRTDAAGVASASFKLPDNVTSWRVIALAMDKGELFGCGSASFAASKDVVAGLKAPTYMVAGDTARLTALAQNNLDAAQALTVGVEEEGLEPGPGERSLAETVAPGERAALSCWVTAGPGPEARVEVTAASPAAGDAAAYKFPIYPRGSEVRQAFAGRLDDEVTYDFALAKGVERSSFHGDLTVTPSLAATLSHGLGFYRDYPYDSAEATLNRFLVNAEVAAAAQDIGLAPTPLAQGLPEAIAAGFAALREQYPGGGGEPYTGGWSWAAGGPVSPYITAYVLDGLTRLEGNPFVPTSSADVVRGLRNNGLVCIEGYFKTWRETPAFEADAVSLYVTDVALRAGAVAPGDDIVRKVVDYYYETRPAREPMSQALLASVLQQTGDAARLAVVMRNLDNGAQAGPDDTVYWGERPENAWRWWDDAVETTSKVLEVKLAYQPDDPRIPRMVDWLVDQRRGAAWKSTKDSAAATLALMKYIKAHPELAAPVAVAYKVGKEEGTLTLDPASYEKPGAEFQFGLDAFAGAGRGFSLRRASGEGPAFYTAAIRYFASAEKAPAAPGSVTLARSYALVERKVVKGDVEETKVPLKGAVKLGDDVEVTLTVKSPYDFDYVVVEDPKPAGFIYLDATSGYRGPAGGYAEVRERQRNVFFERLPAGETVIRYRLRAEIPGTYAALPAKAYGVYSPDIGSGSASAAITVAE